MATFRDRFGSCMRVEKKLVPLKMTYFIMYAGVAILLPYIPLFQKQLGMSTVESGIINGLMPFIGFLARPVFGMIADKLRRHKLVFMIACLATGLLHLLLILVPAVPGPVPPPVDYTLSCADGQAAICQNQVMEIFSKCHNNRSADTRRSTKCFLSCTKSNQSQLCLDDHCPSDQPSLDFKIMLRNHDKHGIPYFDSRTVLDLPAVDNGPSSSSRNGQNYGGSSTSNKEENCQEIPISNVYIQRKRFSRLTCRNDTSIDCVFRCENHACLSDYDPRDYHFRTAFWAFLFVFLFASLAFSPLTNLMDAMAYEQIGEKKHTWGQQRVWGTVGFVILAACSGPILGTTVVLGETDYAIIFYIFGGFMMLTAVSSHLMKVPENFRCSNLMKNTCQLLRDFAVMSFLVAIFILGFFFGVINTFLFWFLVELIAASGQEGSEKMIIGLALFCASGMELPTIFFSGRIIKKIGEVACISLAFVGYAIRFLAYYVIQNPWHVLPCELLHGVTFGVMFPAATLYANKISPPGMSATLQGLLSGTHFGFGWGVGALVGGVLYENIGARHLFLSCSVTSLLALVTFVTLNVLVMRRRKPADKAAVYTVNGDRGDGGVQVRDLMAPDGQANHQDDADEKPADETANGDVTA